MGFRVCGNKRIPYLRFQVTNERDVLCLVFGPTAQRIYNDVWIGALTEVHVTTIDKGGAYRVKNVFFPELPESYEECIKRKYGSWSNYRKKKKELLASQATKALFEFEYTRLQEEKRIPDYEAYNAFKLILDVHPLNGFECKQLLDAYRRALDWQDKLRIENIELRKNIEILMNKK